MNDLLLTILEKLYKQVSLNQKGEICVGDICQSAYDWLESIVALENSDSDEMMVALKCVHKTPNIEKKIEKIAFLQCNRTTCWAATAVMLAKYYDSSIKYNNEREYLESKCPSPLEKNAAENMYRNIDGIINALIPEVRKNSGSESARELQILKNKIDNIFRTDTLSRYDVAQVLHLFRSNTLVMNAIETYYNVRNMYIQINNSWFQYYAEAFYDPENRKGDTTLAPGLQLDQVDVWFNTMMKFDIDKFDSNNIGKFTLQYFANKLLNGPVIIDMPSEIVIGENLPIDCKVPDNNNKPCWNKTDITDCLQCAIINHGNQGYPSIAVGSTHYVLFYGMNIENKEIVCKYVETIYYESYESAKHRQLIVAETHKGKPYEFRSNVIPWKTLKLWMESKLNLNKIVIYKK